MAALPDPQKSTADDQAQKLIAAVNEAMAAASPAAPTSFHDRAPVPSIGPTPPVPQPGRPPMSQRATDASVLMLSAGAASVPIGGMTCLVLYTLGHADPTSLAIGGAMPVALAVPILALCRLAGRAKQAVEAAPAVHHHHYEGDVHQDFSSVNTNTRGLIARTRNELSG